MATLRARGPVPTLDDDRGHTVHLEGHPTRIVSLVPSLTEALAVTVPDRLVGATDWCTHTAGLEVPRVRGTKNPDHSAIGRLGPDLVVANQEENRQIDVERLRQAGLPVWVTVVESLDQALRSLRRLLVDVVGPPSPSGWSPPRPSGTDRPSSRRPVWWCRSGGTPGWSSARAPSAVTWWSVWDWSTSSPQPRTGIRGGRSPT
jgi:hypothetical protein